MRITKEAMLRLARDITALRTNQDRSIVCAYLTGSLVREDPFIGGATDVDLFFIHSVKPEKSREILYLSDDVSLDIAHIEQFRFQQPRHLRADAWLGPFLCAKPKVLYDTQHWFEFTEASVAAQFYRPEYVLERARPMAAAARQLWMDFHLAQPEPAPVNVLKYLNCVQNAGNAIALLSGTPLTERRFLIDLPARLDTVRQPTIFNDFEKIVLPTQLSDLDWTQWITRWEPVLTRVANFANCPSRLTRPRHNYYTRAVHTLTDEYPSAAAWILLNIWTEAVALFPSDDPILGEWKQACVEFLQIKDTFNSVWNNLDSLLDSVESIIDAFASENGLTE